MAIGAIGIAVLTAQADKWDADNVTAKEGITSLANLISSQTAGAPAKRQTAVSLRALANSSTTTDPLVKAELRNDADRLDHEAAVYDEFVERTTPQLADMRSFSRALDAAVAALRTIIQGG
jgi:hypothetical protein